ncbi:hypothetical protein KDW19_17025 [Burkholderia cenocepacia]|uniref:hypothetical protein n=1 Tax=Burkholderia cepacia complex TaxID=87882 RepID=UPI000F56F6A4|nr:MULTISPECIES: hypothetical protein [Burkholderia cepacia complex]ELW9446460.1 hypothetical protein [Burkholderia cenocepacia]MBR8484152.1 hypothetical protein [Burkholderia cenocepacia]MDN7469128.1 hypothetical protein [Burkholderia orbicola]MDN7504866.1 hypothetical protein [Burkholderia orbicola]
MSLLMTGDFLSGCFSGGSWVRLVSCRGYSGEWLELIEVLRFFERKNGLAITEWLINAEN